MSYYKARSTKRITSKNAKYFNIQHTRKNSHPFYHLGPMDSSCFLNFKLFYEKLTEVRIDSETKEFKHSKSFFSPYFTGCLEVLS